MKTFKQYMAEEASRIYPDTPPKKQFGDDTKMKLLGMGIKPPENNPNKQVDTTGANSPFADRKVKSHTIHSVTPDKPMVGKNSKVQRALAAVGRDSEGKQIRTTSQPNVRSARAGVGTDTKFKLAKIQRNIKTDSPASAEKQSQPQKSSISDTGVKKTTNTFEPKRKVVPIPKDRPKDLKTYDSKSFKSTFAYNKNKGEKEFDWTDPKTGIKKRYTTKVKGK